MKAQKETPFTVSTVHGI